jgi:mannosyltransferase
LKAINYDKRSLGPLLALAAVMLLASVLRFYGLEIQSLRFDELETWRYAIKSPPGILEATGVSGSDPHPPGYYLFIHYWMQLAGDAEWALRLPSAVAGVLSVLVTFLLGRRLYSAREGLIAALLMTVLWTPIYYSQEARAYSFLLLAAALSGYFWFGIVKKLEESERVSPWESAGYVLSAVAACYVHYIGAYLIMLQGLWTVCVFVARPRLLLRPLALYGLILLAYLPWVATLYGRLTSVGGTPSYIDVPGWSQVPGYLKFLFNGAGEEQAAIWPPNNVEPLVLAVVLALYGFLLFRGFYDSPGIGEGLFRRETLLSPSFVLGLWLVVPFAGLFLLSLIWKPVLMFRVMVVALPAAYLLIARAIVLLPFRPAVQNGLALLGAGLLLAQLLFALDYSTEPHTEQAREVTRFLAHNGPPHSLIVYSGALGGDFVYYFERYGIRFKQEPRLELLRRRGQSPREKVALLRRKLKSGDYDYVLYMRVRPLRPKVGFLKPLFRSGELEVVKEKRYVKAEGYVFKVGKDIR